MTTTIYEERIIETVKKVMPATVSIVVGKDYEALLRERPYELMNPHGDHVDLPPPEEELPHTPGGKIRIGLSEDELAFYDALATNDSAVAVLGAP